MKIGVIPCMYKRNYFNTTFLVLRRDFLLKKCVKKKTFLYLLHDSNLIVAFLAKMSMFEISVVYFTLLRGISKSVAVPPAREATISVSLTK